MTSEVASGWTFHIDEGPDWIFLRLNPLSEDRFPEPPVAARAWAIAEERGKQQMIFELGDGVTLTSHLVGQLILLHKRAKIAGGKFRICGFPAHAEGSLRTLRMADRFPNYHDREAAVMGHKP